MRVKFTDGGVEPKTITALAIPVGTVFKGRMGIISAAERLYLRFYDGIVDLATPQSIWTIVFTLQVFDYRPYADEDVELVIHE